MIAVLIGDGKSTFLFYCTLREVYAMQRVLRYTYWRRTGSLHSWKVHSIDFIGHARKYKWNVPSQRGNRRRVCENCAVTVLLFVSLAATV